MGLTPLRQSLEMDVSSEVVVLSVAALSLVLMVGGSLLFPDKEPIPLADATTDDSTTPDGENNKPPETPA